MAKQFTLGAHERLKSRKSIEQLFSEGKKIEMAPYRILYLATKLTSAASLVFSVGVSAKNFKKAVDRNSIKRWTREAWRLQNQALKEKTRLAEIQLNVFFIYTGKALPGYEEIVQKVKAGLEKLEKKVAG